MRTILHPAVIAGRVRTGLFASDDSAGNNGAFFVRGGRIKVIASEACEESEWWEHVSVSLKTACPTWNDMCYVKDLFWQPEEVVIQFHPAKSNYINVHPYCLHLFRNSKLEQPCPPTFLIG